MTENTQGGVWWIVRSDPGESKRDRNQGDRSLDYEFIIKGPVPLIPPLIFQKGFKPFF